MDDILKDKRFAHVAKDPRFRKIPVGERKVKIDKRFKGMFKDKRFKLKYSVDKRGKPVDLTTSENLKKYYELSDEDSSDSDGDEDAGSKRVVNDSEDSDDSDGNLDNEGDDNVKEVNMKKRAVLSQAHDKRFQSKVTEKEPDLRGDSDDSDNSSENSDSDDDGESNLSKGRKNKISKAVDSRFQTKLTKKCQKDKSKEKIKIQEQREHTIKDKGKALKSKKLNIEDNSEEENSEVDLGELEESSSGDENSDDEEEVKPLGNDSGVDFARGEGNMYSSSSDDEDGGDGDDNSDDESDDSDDQDESKFDHRWGEADDNIVSLEEATSRLAVCNMDWDRMKAKDIYVLLNSFKPANAIIKSVKVYPSEFGKERMAEEATHGPRELKELKIDSDEEEDEVVSKDGTTYHREKLRQYQLKRLKYYYAVVECDSTQTADHIYKECDGMEYESSSTKLDLRFIPDEETFEEEEVKSGCTEIPANYKPQFFYNAALSQSKVDLTWDETDRERVQLTSQQFSGKGDDVKEEDLKAYLASSSDEEAPDYGALFRNTEEDRGGEEESDEDRRLDKYKQLLTDIDSEEKKKKGDIEMEISWEPGLREATENLVKKKKQSKDSTVWGEYLEKKKEKRKKKIEERNKKKKSLKESDSDVEQNEKKALTEGDTQAFSDDELPVDEDMAAFMAEENSSEKKKKSKDKKKRKKKKPNEETPEISKEKAELSLLMMDEDDNKKHFNLRDLMEVDGKKKKKKRKEQKNKDQEEDFQVNVTDPRFSAVYESHLFNIDPSAPEYRKTKGTEAMISEKINRSGKRDKNKRSLSSKEDEQVKKPKLMDRQTVNDDNLASLIKSVKTKTKHFHGNKSKR